MVSLTFDEFHAIRSRQRATAAAEASAVGSDTDRVKISSKNAPTLVLSSDKLTDSKNAVAAAAANQGIGASAPSVSLSQTDSSGASDQEVAPTSGSVVRKTQQRRAGKSDRKSGWVRARGIGSVANLGSLLELYEVQAAVVVMIYLDLVASTAQLFPFLQPAEGGEAGGAGGTMFTASGRAGFGGFVVRLVSRLIQSFTGFTVVFFAIELVMLLAVFRGKFFRHLGYVIDLVVVSACLYQELAGTGKGMRLLGALRVWRVARVINTLLLSAEEAHEQTRVTLRQVEKSTQDLEIDRRRLQETLRREVEARKQVDKMLRGYKDEVETLNEALKIAAMDIAAAGVSPDMGPGGEEKIRKSGTASAASDSDSSAGSSGGGGGYESVGEAGEGQAREQQPQQQQGSSSGANANRIFVFEDGTFQAR